MRRDRPASLVLALGAWATRKHRWLAASFAGLAVASYVLTVPALASAVGPHIESTVVGGAYVYLSEKEPHVEYVIGLAGELTWAGSHHKPEPFDTEAARLKAVELAGRIRAGDFSLTEHAQGKHAECNSFCPLRHACRQPTGFKSFRF